VDPTGQRVVLVHELGQLAGYEEFLDRCHHGTDVVQGLRGDRLNVLSGHAFTHDTFHTREPRTDLVLDQFTHRADAAVTKVVNIVGFDNDLRRTGDVSHFRMQRGEVLNRGHDVFNP